MKPKSIHKIKNDRNGGIVGLPLQLLIIVVIASLSLALILGWMSNIETPKSIGAVEANPGTINPIFDGENYVADVTITVFDQDGNPLEGATVVLTGMGIKNPDGTTAYGITDGNGTVHFENLILSIHGQIGYVNAEVSKSGYGENSTCRITVIP